jgi:predicted translation initiation factor SUI1
MNAMGRASQKQVLFLCTGNYYRSRFAECLFDSVAGKMGLPWKASSRALALERGVNNVGPMATAAVQGLRDRGVRSDAVTRKPVQAVADDLEQVDRVVALQEAEHRPLLEERFPAWVDRVEYWHVEDADGAETLDLIEREVMDLIARLLGGGKKRPEGPLPVAETPRAAPPEKPKEKPVVRVGRETKGRRGKGVTIVSDVPLNEAGLRELAARLKQRCGTGGTVRDGCIEIQGDQRDRLIAELEAMGYKVKRSGG